MTRCRESEPSRASAAGATPAPLELLDNQTLTVLARAGSGLLLQVIDLYLSSAPELIDVTEQALAADRNEEAPVALHRLKGSSATIGAVALARLCEQPLQDGVALRETFHRTKEALEAEKALLLRS